jgi:hypothetical protein
MSTLARLIPIVMVRALVKIFTFCPIQLSNQTPLIAKPTMIMLIIMVILPGHTCAAEQMDVTKLDALYLDRFINFTVEWQSVNPVLKVMISAGRETKEVAVDEFDNHRNPSGYQGAVTIQLQVEPQYSQSGIPYVVQMEDELKQKSTVFSGKVSVTPATNAVVQQAHADDTWGRENLKTGMSLGPQPAGVTRAGDMIDKLLVVMDRMDVAPSIGAVKVNIMGSDSVSFSTRATDDKGLREIKFRIFDSRGMLVGVQSLTNLGKVWEGTSQPFNLGGGTFRVIAQAIDSAGNTSKEQSANCTLTGEPKQLAQIQEQQGSTQTPTTPQPPVTAPLPGNPTALDPSQMIPGATPPMDQTSPFQSPASAYPSQPSPYQSPTTAYPTQSSPYQTPTSTYPTQSSPYQAPTTSYPTQTSPYQTSSPQDQSQPTQYQVSPQQFQQSPPAAYPSTPPQSLPTDPGAGLQGQQPPR